MTAYGKDDLRDLGSRIIFLISNYILLTVDRACGNATVLSFVRNSNSVQNGFHVAPPGRDCTSRIFTPPGFLGDGIQNRTTIHFRALRCGRLISRAFGRGGIRTRKGGREKNKKGFLKKARNSTLAGEWECRWRSNCFSELFFSVHQLRTIKRLCAKRNLQQHFISLLFKPNPLLTYPRIRCTHGVASSLNKSALMYRVGWKTQQ